MPDDKIRTSEQKAKAAERARNYRLTHKEQIRQKEKEYRARPEVKAKRAQYLRRPEVRARIKELKRIAKLRGYKPPPRKDRNSENLKTAQRREAEYAIIAGRPKPENCDICGEKAKKICFDHCHTNGHFRGFLCNRCNSVLGYVKDDPVLLEIMAAYLREPPPNTPPPQPTLPGI